MPRKSKETNPEDNKVVDYVYVSGPVERIYLSPEEEADPSKPGVVRGETIALSALQVKQMGKYGYTFSKPGEPAPEDPPASDPVFDPALATPDTN